MLVVTLSALPSLSKAQTGPAAPVEDTPSAVIVHPVETLAHITPSESVPLGRPYPKSPEINSLQLDQTLRTQLYYPSQRADFKEREETREKLCGSVIHRPDSSPNAVEAALTVAEADMNADVLFEKGKGEGADSPGQKFSFSIQMSETTCSGAGRLLVLRIGKTNHFQQVADQRQRCSHGWREWSQDLSAKRHLLGRA